MNLYKNGYEIEKNGEVITLNWEELMNILDALNAQAGYDSLLWYLEDNKENLTDEQLAKGYTMLKDAKVCCDIHSDYEDRLFCDSGWLEVKCIEGAIADYVLK